MIVSSLRTGLAAVALLAAIPCVASQGSAVQPIQDAAGAASRGIRLSYALYGHGLHVLDVVADLRLTSAGYSVVLRDHSAGLLSLMVHTDVTSIAVGRFVGDTVLPLHFESAGFSRGAMRRTVLDYPDGNPVVRVLTPAEPRRDPVDIAQARGSIDTLAALAELVRRVDQTGSCDGGALIFDGLRLSRASSRGAGRQTVPQDDRSPYSGTALRCDFSSLEIGGFLHDDDEAQMRQPKTGSAWVASVLQGAPALPVRITFQSPKLGLATMFLIKVEALPAAPIGSRASL